MSLPPLINDEKIRVKQDSKNMYAMLLLIPHASIVSSPIIRRVSPHLKEEQASPE